MSASSFCRVVLGIVFGAGVAACGGSDPGPGNVDGGAIDAPAVPDAALGTPDAAPDMAGPLYAPDHIVEVQIDMAAADWTTMRNQTRQFPQLLEGNCLAQPFPSPFTKFPAAITIDGTHFDMVAVHKKGFLGSLSTEKPSIKVDFNDFIAGQKYLGLGKITLNNAHQDPSYIRQCLTYPVFAAAGLKAPRCNFAHVRVNGEDLGLYVNVETYGDTWLSHNYADGSGNLYEGTLSDFRTDFVNTFDPKTNGSTADRSDLQPIVSILETASDAQLVAQLSSLVDMDEFFTYWATEIITGHWDGYANNLNNFYIYHDPTSGKIEFLPYGADATFSPNHPFGPGGNGTQTPPNAVAAKGLLARRLYLNAATRGLYLSKLHTLLDSAWNETTLLQEIDRMALLVTPLADAGDGVWPAAVQEVRNFVTNRRSVLDAELGAGTPNWTYPLGGSPCLTQIGTVSGTFTASWGTINSPNPFMQGGGTIDLVESGSTIGLNPIGAEAGPDPNPTPGAPEGPHPVVQLIGQRADGKIMVVAFSVYPSLYVAGTTVDLNLFSAYGVVYRFDPATMSATQDGVVIGTIHFNQAGSSSGAAVSGTFTGDVDMWNP